VTKGIDEVLEVLVVENDSAEYECVTGSLTKDSNAPVRFEQACDFEDAFRKIKTKPFDVLLVDSRIDEQSGLEFLEEIRRQRISMPFVLMTPVEDDALVRKAVQAGVADVVVKNDNEYRNLILKIHSSYRSFYGLDFEASRTSGSREAPAGELPKDQPPSVGAVKDELTGLFNHSYLHERVVYEFSKANRYRYPISCLMIDIDHFKSVNEENGYGVGDRLLKQCAGLLFEQCRLGDIIARYGGEEFAVLLPHIDYMGALDLARRLRKVFAKHPFIIDDKEVSLTISIGISSFPEDPVKRRGELLSFADRALFQSKTSGRNRVSLYREMTPVVLEDMPEIKIPQEKIVEFQRRMSESAEVARRSYIEASTTLVKVLESKDAFTAGHAARCGKYAKEVAETLGMSTDDVEIVQHAALLHDIGKICIPDEILLKPARLTFSEYEAMKQHSYLGYKILKPIKFLREESQYVLHHHEWFNGEGYPCHLRGGDIPLGSRIISVVDSYDTMRTAGGRYKSTCSADHAVNELISCAGTQFDPEVVRAFVEILKARGEIPENQAVTDRLDKIVREHRKNL
jgi:diguanylate cyclase (GGDEF)-like protein/putative nucleotidyltransferase with HDIG domain